MMKIIRSYDLYAIRIVKDFEENQVLLLCRCFFCKHRAKIIFLSRTEIMKKKIRIVFISLTVKYIVISIVKIKSYYILII